MAQPGIEARAVRPNTASFRAKPQLSEDLRTHPGRMMCARARECPQSGASPHRTILRNDLCPESPRGAQEVLRGFLCTPGMEVSGDVVAASRCGATRGRLRRLMRFALGPDLPGPRPPRARELHPVLFMSHFPCEGSSRAVGAARRRLQEGLRACQFRSRGVPVANSMSVPGRPAPPCTARSPLAQLSSSVAKLLFLLDKATNGAILPRRQRGFAEKYSSYAICSSGVGRRRLLYPTHRVR